MSRRPPTAEDEAATHHVDRIAEAHRVTRQTLMQAESSHVPKNRAWYLVDTPNANLWGSSGSRRELVLRAHAAVIDYSEQVQLLVDDLPDDLWSETFYRADVPADQGKLEERGSSTSQDRLRDYYNQMEQHHTQLRESDSRPSPADSEFETVAVSLDSLPQWRSWFTKFHSETERPGFGSTRQAHDVRRILPLAASAFAYQRLNKCLAEVGLRAAVDEPLDDDTPPEPPEHVREQAPGFTENGQRR